MSKIELLDSGTIDAIAAGEVVERPSSVVKELAENAVDAGAGAITVEIRGGGKELIRVTDNGSGIEADMTARAFERHSTSKLRSIKDLQTIGTLGFRGEALSSIAAVAKVEMMTKTQDSFTGTLYRIEGGVEKECEPVGVPDGTTILVRDLFYNVPARKKFLKTDQTETAGIAELLSQLALSHPEIAFKFISDGKVKMQTAGSGNLQDVIYRLYGSRITKNLMEIDEVSGPYHLYGYLGKPALSRGNRRFESVFVNGRYVKDRIMQKGMEDGYKRYLMQHQFPLGVIFLDADGRLVDVNVHPAKAQVRFSEEKAVYDFVRESVSKALHSQELIESLPLEKKADSTDLFSRGSFSCGLDEHVREQTASYGTAEPYEVSRRGAELEETDGQAICRERLKMSYQPQGQELRAEFAPASETSGETEEKPVSYEQASLPIPPVKRQRFRLIGSLFDTYWLLEFDGKLYLIDQHAAHERVNYEKFLRMFKTGPVVSQQVFPAVPVTLQAQEAQLAERYADYIRSYGFRIDYFGGNEYRITAVPAAMSGMNAEAFFLSFLGEISDLTVGTVDPDTFTDRLAAAACKASIKGHDVISEAEAKHLLELLFACDDPYHCPHGRPTLVCMTKSEIEKMFRRIVP